MKHLLSLNDLSPGDVSDILTLAEQPDLPRVLAGKGEANW